MTRGAHVLSLLVEFIVLPVSSFGFTELVSLQSIKPGELTEDMRFVIFLIDLVDSCHLFYPFRFEVSGGEPLSIMRSF
jgi:hypothetical protein